MSADEPLFEVEARPLHKGDQVTVQTMWGDEPGTVVALRKEAGYPMAQIDLANGDTISIDVARVSR